MAVTVMINMVTTRQQTVTYGTEGNGNDYSMYIEWLVALSSAIFNKAMFSLYPSVLHKTYNELLTQSPKARWQ